MNGTILIVDDDDDTAVLLRDSLRKRGYEAYLAGEKVTEPV